MKKKLGWILSLTLCFALMIAATLVTASADTSVSYIDANGTTRTCDSATVVTENDTAWGASDSQEHWYVVNSNVTINTRITVTGDVHLILADECTLNASQGITVADNDSDVNNGSANSLTIYGQSGGTGKLTADRRNIYLAGIGGGKSQTGGTITINGGTVNTTGGQYGAGIGGGDGGDGGTITINGGTVNATSGEYGAGIGGGSSGAGGTITINGGTVNATGGIFGAVIGGGGESAGGTITINGGTVNATGDGYGAGIGGGGSSARGADCGTITINGGTVNATSGYYGAGIGSNNGAGGTISINGGTVTATATSAGIGSVGGTINITINGSTVTATGGISSNGNVKINNAVVYATAGDKAAISSSAVSVSNQSIVTAMNLLGDSISGTVTVNNSIVTVNAGTITPDTEVTFNADRTILKGMNVTIPESTTLTIADGVKLTNNGTIISYGTITNNGTIQNNGVIYSDQKDSLTASGDGEFHNMGSDLTVSYLDVEGTEATATADRVLPDSTQWTEGWYVVDVDVSILFSRIAVTGDVNLILADGCTLTASQGINVVGDNSLTIYGQSDGTGTLVATGGNEGAGIGGGSSGAGGTITINGGTVTATGGGYSAGIGGGSGQAGGTITINGGTVTATGGDRGAGIGGGRYGAGGAITINGGTVNATGGYDGAGIGGGSGDSGVGGDKIVINGGTVNAWAGQGSGNALGGGRNGQGGKITVNGGTVYANKSPYGGGEGIGWQVQLVSEPGSSGIIVAESVSSADLSGFNGIIKRDSTYTVYGSANLATNLEILSGETMQIDAGKTLTIQAGVTLTNNGAITNSGTIICNGTINGEVDGDVRYPSGVTVSLTQGEQNVESVSYGSTITITATMTKQTATNALTAVEGTVDFYLGNVNTGTKLGTSKVESGSEDTYTATVEVTLTSDQWKPGSYTITADFGGVAGTSGDGLLNSTGTAELTVTKASQTAPAAPAMFSRTTTSVTLDTISGGQGTVQYGYTTSDNTSDYHWQNTPEFSGLQPGTDYTFYARYSGDNNYNPAVSVTGTKTSTLSTTGPNVVNPGETVTTDDGTTIKNDGEKITITPGNGGTTTTITPDDNVTVNTGDGTVNVPGGSTVQTGDGSSITVGEDGATVGTDGGVTLPEGGSATVGDTEITVPGGGTITPNGDGSVTIPGGSTVVDKDGDEYTYPPEGGTLDPDGTVVYTITVTFDSQGGSDVASRNVDVNTPVAEPDAPTRSGYSFRGWYTAASGGEEWDFSAPVTGDMTLYARWSMNNIPDTYDIELIVGEGGEARTSLGNASAGTNITVTATPDAGYELAYITVDGERIDGTTFKMPAHDVTVRVYFTNGSATLPFTDVADGDWFYDYVAYVYANGLMDGTSDTAFEPNANMTRAMVWAILARIDGETVTGAAWATNARAWAMAEGVSDGTDPNGLVTREQFATMLYRYAVAKGYDVSIGESTNILSYADFASISEYAIPAMQWACGSGIVTGVTDTTLVPQGTATRAQCAAMLMRFAEL